MSDYITESHLFANLSEDDESQRNVVGNTRNDEQSEEILLRMIRGRDVMTTDNVPPLVDVIGASTSKVTANINVGRKGAQSVRDKCKNTGNTMEQRGKNKINFGSNGPEKMIFNHLGQPVAPSKTVAKFSRYIGSIAREPSVFPINITDFRNFKGTGRVKGAWLDIKAKIDWSNPETLAKLTRIKKTVRNKLSARWRKHKHMLHVNYYLGNEKQHGRFVCPDGDVNQQQWRALVLHWDKFGEEKTTTGKKNRTQLKVAANTGTKTFAQVRYEWELVNPGKVLDRCTFWRIVHSKPKKDGNGTEPINANAEAIFLELDKLEQRERLNGREITADVLNELFGEQFGPETRNTVRGYGIGVEWNDIPGIQTNRRRVCSEVEALRGELEASRSVIANLQDETAKKNDEMQTMKSQLNAIDARLDSPLHSILSGGADSINKFIAALTQIAGEKQAQVISHGMHSVATPSEGYRSLLSS